MTDIVARLRNWRSVHLARLHILMEQAADEMERLSLQGDCPVPDNAANEDNDKRLAALQALSAADEELRLPHRTPAAYATPRECSEQDECTLTDAERRAVSYYLGTGGPDAVDATLVALLERMT